MTTGLEDDVSMALLMLATHNLHGWKQHTQIRLLASLLPVLPPTHTLKGSSETLTAYDVG